MKHLVGILSHPHEEWAKIREEQHSVAGHYLRHLLWLAILPPLAWWYGASQIGWELGGRTILLTSASAAQIMGLFYVAILLSVAFLGYMVYWMAKTYDAQHNELARGIAVASYMCTPMFIVGLTGLIGSGFDRLVALIYGAAKAEDGVAGVRMASTPASKASSKSRLIRVRTFWARR